MLTTLIILVLAAIGQSRTLTGDEAALREWFVDGLKLTPVDVSNLEARLKREPDSLELRAKLATYYLSRPRNEPGSSFVYDAAAQEHIYWIVENHPGAEFLRLGHISSYTSQDDSFNVRLSELWQRQTLDHVSDPRVLANAAMHFRFKDASKAEELWLRCRALDPGNPEWPEALGREYTARARRAPRVSSDTERVSTDLARQSLVYLREAIDKTEPNDRYLLLVDAGAAALQAGNVAAARQYAVELLDAAIGGLFWPWFYGNAVHHGNLLLGRLALLDGKLDEAERYLIKAGDTPVSPQVNSFGPGMALAAALLQKGRQDTVLEYLKRCGKFWKDPQLTQWVQQIEAGETPDFGWLADR